MPEKLEPAPGLSEQLVDLLNQLMTLDPEATQEIMLRKSAVPVSFSKETDVSCVVSGANAKTSALGIINGALSKAGLPMVAMMMNTSDKVEAFAVLKPKTKAS